LALSIRLVSTILPVAAIFALALTAALEAIAEALAILLEAFRFTTLAADAMNLGCNHLHSQTGMLFSFNAVACN
jgi:hypothetical protein